MSPFGELPTTRPTWAGHYTDTYLRTELRGLLRVKTPIYRVTLNKDFPLCLHSSDGATYRPAMSFETDGGTIPPIVQTVRLPWINLKRDTFPRAYRFHDSGCDKCGYWVWGGERWVFHAMSREKIDWLLRDALMADGANAVERSLVYNAVRLYARLKA